MTFTYDRGTFEIANIGDKVIYTDHNVENNNSSRVYWLLLFLTNIK